MKWLKLTIETTSDNADIAAAMLTDFGVEGVEIIDPYANALFIEGDASNWDYVEEDLTVAEKGMATLRFYMRADTPGETLEGMRAALETFGKMDATIVDDDWSDAWKQHYKPFGLGQQVVVVPVWEDYQPADGEVVFKIDPGHVFGTGQHQSTALCVEAIELFLHPNGRVLDIGCGSGILGIIALLLGAQHTTAVDIDPSAQKVCEENAAHNGFDAARFTALTGDMLAAGALRDEIHSGKYQLIAANIIADVIIRLAPDMPALLTDDGVFVSGGIIRDRADEVVAAIEAAGMMVLAMAKRDEWVAIVASASGTSIAGAENV